MTVATGSAGEVEQYEGDGLEDMDDSDIVIPRLTLDHKKGLFRDNMTNAEYPSLECIILGLVKQRVLWDATVEEGEKKPMCKSTNHIQGFPLLKGQDKTFPWALSKLNQEDYPPNSIGQVVVPCQDCFLKEWTSAPNGKNPYCSEQYTLAVMYNQGDDTWTPALLTFQKSGVKSTKTYLGDFKRKQEPAYTAVTTISLNENHRGNVDYCTPVFKKGAATPKANYAGFSQSFGSIRSFVRQPPAVYDEDGNRLNPVAEDGNMEAVVPASTGPVTTTPAATPPVAVPVTPVAATPVAPPVAAAAAPTPPTAPPTAAPVAEAGPASPYPAEAFDPNDDEALPF